MLYSSYRASPIFSDQVNAPHRPPAKGTTSDQEPECCHWRAITVFAWWPPVPRAAFRPMSGSGRIPRQTHPGTHETSLGAHTGSRIPGWPWGTFLRLRDSLGHFHPTFCPTLFLLGSDLHCGLRTPPSLAPSPPSSTCESAKKIFDPVVVPAPHWTGRNTRKTRSGLGK